MPNASTIDEQVDKFDKEQKTKAQLDEMNAIERAERLAKYEEGRAQLEQAYLMAGMSDKAAAAAADAQMASQQAQEQQQGDIAQEQAAGDQSSQETAAPPIALPDLRGQSPSSAQSNLSKLKLASYISQQTSETAPTSPLVLSTIPLAGTPVTPGQTITLVVAVRPSAGNTQGGEATQNKQANNAGGGNPAYGAVEGKRKEALDEMSNSERQGRSAGDDAKEKAAHEFQERFKQASKKAAEDMVKKIGERAAASAAGEAAVATAPVWLSILGFILAMLLLLGLIILVISTAASICNDNSYKGKIIRGISYVSATFGISDDVCEQLAIDGSYQGGDFANPTPPATNTPGDLRALAPAVPVSGSASDPRVRTCMYNRIVELYRRSQAEGINFEVNSANRPGATVRRRDGTIGPSAHSRGEAVDIAIRPPYPPYNLAAFLAVQENQKKIARLITLARGEGFVSPRADVLDEYNDPTENATGGHIHIEFNIPSNGGSYCDTP